MTEKAVHYESSKTTHKTGLLYRFTKKVLVVLQKLGEGYTQAEIAKMTPFSKQGINYWVKKFLKNRILKLKQDGCPKYYTLTPRGQAILTRSEMPQIPCQMEDYPMKFRLVADWSKIDWVKLGEPKNWVKLGIKIGHVRVEKNLGKQPTVVIHTGQLVGFHPDQCLLEAGTIIADVKAILQGYGVMLDAVGLPLRKAIFKFYTREAELLHDTFGNVSTEDGTLDASPPDEIPHIEHTRQAAINKIGEANRLARIEIRQIEQDKRLAKLTENEERLITVVEKLQTNFELITKGVPPASKQGKKQPRGSNPFNI